MDISNCPGAKRFKQPWPEIIKCPFCSAEVEIWTDEAQATCSECKNKVTRQQEQSCLEWCEYARECVGENIYNKYMKNKRSKKSQRKGISKGR